MYGPLNGVRVALVTLAVLAALMAAFLRFWMVTLILLIGVALHGFGWLYLATGQDRIGQAPLSLPRPSREHLDPQTLRSTFEAG